MIFGIGTDIIEITRIKLAIEKNGERFARRILSKSEQELCSQSKYPERFLAKRFAAKEAFAKALGTGIRNGLNLCDIEVSNNADGKPEINYVGTNAKVESILPSQAKFHITISDEKEYAVAFVIIES